MAIALVESHSEKISAIYLAISMIRRCWVIFPATDAPDSDLACGPAACFNQSTTDNAMTSPARQIHSRPLMERMLLLHQLLLDGNYPNCNKVGKRLEV